MQIVILSARSVHARQSGGLPREHEVLAPDMPGACQQSCARVSCLERSVRFAPGDPGDRQQ